MTASPPTLDYSDEPPGARLTCKRDGDDFVILLPPHDAWSYFRATFATTGIAMMLPFVAILVAAEWLLRSPPLAMALVPVLILVWAAAYQDHARRRARMERKIFLRDDALTVHVTLPATGPRREPRFLRIQSGNHVEDHAIIARWQWRDLRGVSSRFGRLCIAGPRRRTYIDGFNAAERAWLVEILNRRIKAARYEC